MREKYVIKRNFNKSAYRYNQYNFIQKEIAGKLIASYIDEISAHDIILDAGSGTGYVNWLIKKNKLKNQIYQIDLAYNMCKIASNHPSNNCYTVNADIELTPFKNNSFDLIISSLALQWTDLKTSIVDLYRILKDDGKILISVFNSGSLDELARSFQMLDNSQRIINLPKTEYILQVLKNLKFKDININNFKIVDYHSTALEIMRQIKYIGASVNLNHNILNKQKLKDLESIYFDNFVQDNKLPATWNYSIIYAKK